MPAYGTHFLILEKTIEKFLNSPDPNLQKVGDFLNQNKNLARLGSVGPDLFYASKDTLKDICLCMNSLLDKDASMKVLLNTRIYFNFHVGFFSRRKQCL